MVETKGAVRWRGIGASVRGASHVRRGLPNQDAIHVGEAQTEASHQPLILAVADGHGSTKCFRSDIGARLAVDAAARILGEAGGATEPGSVRLCAADLAGALVDEWRDAVHRHVEDAPFSDAELATLEQKEGPAARRAILADPVVAYGCTLLAVLLTDAGLFYLQIGDGDILAVSESGGVTRPVAADGRLFGNETTSLCGRRARHDFRAAFTPLAVAGGMPVEVPALILVSTDGYANSFRDDAGFRRVGSDLLELVRSEGLEAVESSLASWLDEASQLGSGDDVTLGLICRVAATAGSAEPPPDPSKPEPAALGSLCVRADARTAAHAGQPISDSLSVRAGAHAAHVTEEADPMGVCGPETAEILPLSAADQVEVGAA